MPIGTGRRPQQADCDNHSCPCSVVDRYGPRTSACTPLAGLRPRRAHCQLTTCACQHSPPSADIYLSLAWRDDRIDPTSEFTAPGSDGTDAEPLLGPAAGQRCSHPCPSQRKFTPTTPPRPLTRPRFACADVTYDPSTMWGVSPEFMNRKDVYTAGGWPWALSMPPLT